jgi:hypothetical protein
MAENLSQLYTVDKGLIMIIYKGLKKLILQRINNPLKNREMN